MGDRLTARIEEATGIPATSTAHALIEAFRTLQARRVVLVTPYPQSVNDSEICFLDHFGIMLMLKSLSDNLPKSTEVSLDAGVLVFTLFLSLLTGFVEVHYTTFSLTKTNIIEPHK